MSYKRAIEQLRPVRYPKQDIQEKVQSFLTEATMKPDDFFKRDNQKEFIKKAMAGQIIGKDGNKFPAISNRDKKLSAFRKLTDEPDKGSPERAVMDDLIKTYFGAYSKIEKGANGFGNPTSGSPSGEDWESLIAVAVNKINKLKWNQGPEWERAEKYWADYESPSMKLGKEFIAAFKLKNLKQLGASTLPINPEWKGTNKTPKTDLLEVLN